ncbi:bifunctional DNase/RNase [Brevibacterium pityocampae]
MPICEVDAPLWVAEDVYDQVSVETEVQSEDEEEEIKKFRDFVEHVDPEEFEKWTD